MRSWDRFLTKLRAEPGVWKLAGKGLSEAAVESLKRTGVDVATKQLSITRRGRPIFDVMARWPKPEGYTIPPAAMPQVSELLRARREAAERPLHPSDPEA